VARVPAAAAVVEAEAEAAQQPGAVVPAAAVPEVAPSWRTLTRQTPTAMR